MAAWLQSHVLGTEVTCERCRHRWVFTQGTAQPPRESFGEADIEQTLGVADVDRIRADASDDDAPDERAAHFEDDGLDQRDARTDQGAFDTRDDVDTLEANAANGAARDDDSREQRASLWDADDRPPPRH